MTGKAGSKYLLDTVIVAGYFNGESVIKERLSNTGLYVASITIGELYFGAYKAQRIAENLEKIRAFIEIIPVLPCTDITADWYGQIKTRLRKKGRPIPENDIWIAAVAIEHGLILATRDAHFTVIDGLMLEQW